MSGPGSMSESNRVVWSSDVEVEAAIKLDQLEALHLSRSHVDLELSPPQAESTKLRISVTWSLLYQNH